MILLYHLVFPDSTPKDAWNAGLVLRLADFKRQILWLRRHFEFASLEDYLISRAESTFNLKKTIALTFDDGYRSVFDLVSPFLEQEQIPATFFANTNHLQDGELYWFVYFNALCSGKVYSQISINDRTFSLAQKESSLIAWRKLITLARQSGDPIAFSKDFSREYPLPNEVTSKYMGLSYEQLESIGKSSLFDVGGHTHHHPYLNMLPEGEQLEEMLINKNILQDLTGKPVDYFAYTGGEYNIQSISMVKKAGFKAAFAVQPKNLGPEKLFEIERVGIYSPSILKLGLKIKGLDKTLNNLKIKRGK